MSLINLPNIIIYDNIFYNDVKFLSATSKQRKTSIRGGELARLNLHNILLPIKNLTEIS